MTTNDFFEEKALFFGQIRLYFAPFSRGKRVDSSGMYRTYKSIKHITDGL